MEKKDIPDLLTSIVYLKNNSILNKRAPFKEKIHSDFKDCVLGTVKFLGETLREKYEIHIDLKNTSKNVVNLLISNFQKELITGKFNYSSFNSFQKDCESTITKNKETLELKFKLTNKNKRVKRLQIATLLMN